MKILLPQSLGELPLGDLAFRTRLRSIAHLCAPGKIALLAGGEEDLAFIRGEALRSSEELPLEKWGHTYHFDAPGDATPLPVCYWVNGAQGLYPDRAAMPRPEAEAKLRLALEGCAAGQTLYLCLGLLGTSDMPFRAAAVQLTDSPYAAHCFLMDTRPWEATSDKTHTLLGVHMALVKAKALAGHIHVDPCTSTVYVLGSHYALNALPFIRTTPALLSRHSGELGAKFKTLLLMGLEKVAASENPLYFAVASPGAQALPSLAMEPGVRFAGHGGTALWRRDGKIFAAALHQLLYGTLPDGPMTDDPTLFGAITTPREEIVTNALGPPQETLWFWLRNHPKGPPSGLDYTGQWREGGAGAPQIPLAPRNAEYLMRGTELGNAGPNLHASQGVPVSAFVYCGLEEAKAVPILEAFDQEHGMYLEATAVDMRGGQMRPAFFTDALPEPCTQDASSFSYSADNAPRIFAANFFTHAHAPLGGAARQEAVVWLRWVQGRLEGRFEAERTAIGLIPKYTDARLLFEQHMQKNYTQAEHARRFTIHAEHYWAKAALVRNIHKSRRMPNALYTQAQAQRHRLLTHGAGKPIQA